MTDEQTAAKVSALKRERRGYVQRLLRAEKDSNAEEIERLEKRIDAIDALLGDGHVCDVCGFEAKTAGGLTSHQRTHEQETE